MKAFHGERLAYKPEKLMRTAMKGIGSDAYQSLFMQEHCFKPGTEKPARAFA